MGENATASSTLVEALGLKLEPVAINLIKKGHFLPGGYAEPDGSIRHCQAIMRARKGESLIVPAAKQACPIGAAAMGMIAIPEKVASGEFHHKMGMYETTEAARRTMSAGPSLEAGSVIAVATAPLSQVVGRADVVVIIGTPEQVFWLMPAAATFSGGGRVTMEMASVRASCADATVVPYLTGNINISLGCYGCRKHTDIAPEEMLVGIPSSKMGRIVEAVQRMRGGPIQKSRAKDRR